jgi:hypothetical protein
MDTEAETITEELELDANEVDQEADDAPVVVTLGDEPADDDAEIDLPEEAPGWAKKLRETAEERRKRLRELERENRELKAMAAPVEDEPDLGKEPDLEDFDYDTEAFKVAWRAWDAKAKEVDQRKEAKRREAEQAQEQWQAKLTGYEEGKKRLRVPDFEEAEDLVQSVFDQTQQGIIVHGARDAAVLAYAIGKNPEKAKELAAIKDPIAFAFAVSKLEETVKVSTRKPTAKPESVITSTARGSSSVDNHLERLREEAGRTGDFSKVMAYKKQLRAK